MRIKIIDAVGDYHDVVVTYVPDQDLGLSHQELHVIKRWFEMAEITSLNKLDDRDYELATRLYKALNLTPPTRL